MSRLVKHQSALFTGLLAAGVLLALVWRLLAPHTARFGDDQEAAAAVDSTLALLGVLFGALTAGFVLARPSTSPRARTLIAILGSVLGGVISWRLGDHLGTPALRATAAAFVWAVATSFFLFLGALLPRTSARLNSPEFGGGAGVTASRRPGRS